MGGIERRNRLVLTETAVQVDKDLSIQRLPQKINLQGFKEAPFPSLTQVSQGLDLTEVPKSDSAASTQRDYHRVSTERDVQAYAEKHLIGPVEARLPAIMRQFGLDETVALERGAKLDGLEEDPTNVAMKYDNKFVAIFSFEKPGTLREDELRETTRHLSIFNNSITFHQKAVAGLLETEEAHRVKQQADKGMLSIFSDPSMTLSSLRIVQRLTRYAAYCTYVMAYDSKHLLGMVIPRQKDEQGVLAIPEVAEAYFN